MFNISFKLINILNIINIINFFFSVTSNSINWESKYFYICRRLQGQEPTTIHITKLPHYCKNRGESETYNQLYWLYKHTESDRQEERQRNMVGSSGPGK